MTLPPPGASGLGKHGAPVRLDWGVMADERDEDEAGGEDTQSGRAAKARAAEGSSRDEAPPAEQFRLSSRERRAVQAKLPPSVQVLHETIRRQGEQELGRTATALAWSALAAGVSMGFSMLARAMLKGHLPDAPSSFLIESLGYTVGFLIVVLARQQLFTENTMSAVLPFMTRPSLSSFGRLMRLWGIVLVGNVAGVAIFAFAIGHLHLLAPSVREACVAIGEQVMRNSPAQMFTKGVVAGWLIATMVWLVPAAEHAKVAIIVLMTYLIAIGDFTHIIVGSTEVLFLVFDGRLPLSDYVLVFGLPTRAGNVVGGSLIFGLISHAQVRSDEG